MPFTSPGGGGRRAKRAGWGERPRRFAKTQSWCTPPRRCAATLPLQGRVRLAPLPRRKFRQLLPHLADFRPGVFLDPLFQIEHGEIVAGGGARQAFPGDRHRDRGAGAGAGRIGRDRGLIARVAEIVDEDVARRVKPSSSCRHSAAGCRRPSRATTRWVKVLTVSSPLPVIGTMMWRPLPPVSLTKLSSFSAARRSRVSRAAATTSRQRTPSPGSRSNTMRSQISRSSSREPRT